ADKSERAYDARRRVQLRRTARDRAGRAGACHRCRRRKDRSGKNRSGLDRIPALYRWASAARSCHSHKRGAARLELPALASGLCRICLSADQLAGLRPCGARRSDRRISPPRAALWWSDRTSRRVKEPVMSELGLRICSSVVLATLAVLMTWLGSLPFYAFWVIAAGLIFLEWAKISAYRPLWLLAGAVYAGAFLAAMILLRDGPLGLAAIFWLFGSVWATDSAAYLAGRAIGGRKLWPSVSPGKTWAGAIAGTIAGVAAGLIVLIFFGIPLHFMHGVFALV